MKKEYLTPVAQKVNFNYRNQVVAAGSDCDEFWTKAKGTPGGCRSRLVSYGD